MPAKAIGNRIYQIRTPFIEGGTVFLYLLKGDTTALVDTGVADSPREVLQPALAELGMALSDVDLILNTHAHLDHAGGNLEVKRASGARIHVHVGDLPLASSLDAQVEFMTAPLRALGFPEEVVQKRADYVRKTAGQPAGADVVLVEGDVVDLGAGMRLRIVHCPGHTPGSVAYYWESEGVLFTGDGVQGHGSRLGGYPLYFDAAAYRRTLAALAEMDFRLLCLGHAYVGGSLINEPTREGEEARGFLRESARVADAIHGAVVSAIGQRPGGTRREVALAALSELIYEIPQLLVRETGMPAAGGPTLHAHIEAALDGSYPAGI